MLAKLATTPRCGIAGAKQAPPLHSLQARRAACLLLLFVDPLPIFEAETVDKKEHGPYMDSSMEWCKAYEPNREQRQAHKQAQRLTGGVQIACAQSWAETRAKRQGDRSQHVLDYLSAGAQGPGQASADHTKYEVRKPAGGRCWSQREPASHEISKWSS
jgi:hypothetical protein